MSDFHAKLDLLRKRQGLSVRALATALHVGVGTVGGWLKDIRPHPEAAKRVADFFAISVDDLLDDTKDLPPHPLRQAALAAQEAFPEDPRAAQATADSINYRRHWKTTSLETARALRQKADELMAMADQLEVPFKREVEEEAVAIERRLDEIEKAARAEQAERDRTYRQRGGRRPGQAS